MRRTLGWTLLASLLCGAWALAAQDYEIKFNRPAKAGMKYSVSSSGTNKQVQTIKVNGEVAQQGQVAFSVALEADVVVVAVDEVGVPTKMEYTIRSFARTDEGQVSASLPAGKVVVVERKEAGDPFSLKDGGVLEEPVLQALDVVIAECKKKATNDDQIFGTKEPKAVGAEWPINAELAAANMTDHGLKVAKENLSGTVKLVGLEKHNDIECLNLSMSIESGSVPIPMPEGMKLEKGAFKATATGLYPLDATQPKQAQAAHMQISAQAKGSQPGQIVVVESHVDRSAKEVRTFAK